MTQDERYIASSEDEQHLSLLGLFHYILGGITIASSFVSAFFIAMGIAGIMGKLDNTDPSGSVVAGWVLLTIGSAWLVLGWTIGILMIAAGRRLQRHRSRTFCLVIAAIECLGVPLGTVLGVFTIVVLTKPSVIAVFEGRPATPGSTE